MCREASLPPRVAIDDFTDLPEDLYNRLDALGAEARARHQHVRHACGVRSLQRADIAVASPSVTRRRQVGDVRFARYIEQTRAKDGQTILADCTDLEAAVSKQVSENGHGSERCSWQCVESTDHVAAVLKGPRQRWLGWIAPAALAKLVTSVTATASSLTGANEIPHAMRSVKAVRITADSMRFVEDMV